MIKKVVTIRKLDDPDSRNRDLTFWLTKTPAERVATVDFLRRQYYGDTGRLQRIGRVVNRITGETRIIRELETVGKEEK